MTYTVAELLGDPELATISLTPGVGEQREITWAHVCELADPWNWLGDGALVMTTGLDIPEAKISRSTTSSDRTPRASRLSRLNWPGLSSDRFSCQPVGDRSVSVSA